MNPAPMNKNSFSLTFLWMICCATLLNAQQMPDTTFAIDISNPSYQDGNGPTICIDSAHNNFHTADGGYAPFARVMRADGYSVSDLSSAIRNLEALNGCNIYMMINPLHASNLGNWQLPTPSAFPEEEIDVIKAWVERGGSLFLIADHMPFGGAAKELAASFGFNISNGFAFLEKPENQPDVFNLENGRLPESPILQNEITTVTSFTGSAFTYPEEAIPVLVFKEGDYSLEPEIAWQFDDDTKRIDLNGYAQGALLEVGKGKVAMFGEAAMFTAQTFTGQDGTVIRVGLNSKGIAPQNLDFLLNLIHWLD